MLIGEASLAALGIRPDYAVNVSGSTAGYLEVKAPGRGVPTMWTPNGHERRQWEQMRLLPNVLYTDGERWALLRSGELVGSVARLNGDLRHAGSRLAPDGDGFIRVLQDFLLWQPNPPLTVSQLVKAAANLCRLLRGEVAETLAREHTGEETYPVFTGLAEDWRALLFPGLTDQEFADAYAQTVTFALLLARVDGITFNGEPLSEIARQLGKKHSLMGKALAVLTEQTVEGRSIVVATMLRVFGVIDWDQLSNGRQDTYLREYLRRTADEGWIIDLSPEGHQPEVNTRIFPGVQHPLCIGIFARYGAGNPAEPANIHHVTVSGLRDRKFEQLAGLMLASPDWVTCATGWQDRLVPAGDHAWETYPLFGDLMPWQAPGVKPNRTWVHAPAEETLRARWHRITKAPRHARAALLKQTPDRQVTTVTAPLPSFPPRPGTIAEETSPCPALIRIAYRAFDRQYLIPDARIIDRGRPELWQVASDWQVFAVEQHDEPLTAGPGLLFTADVPDMHYFKGRGGRVLPLFRDSACLAANIAPGLLKAIFKRLGVNATTQDFLAYTCGTCQQPVGRLHPGEATSGISA